jgi:fructose-1,6-bisphosphatase
MVGWMGRNKEPEQQQQQQQHTIQSGDAMVAAGYEWNAIVLHLVVVSRTRCSSMYK